MWPFRKPVRERPAVDGYGWDYVRNWCIEWIDLFLAAKADAPADWKAYRQAQAGHFEKLDRARMEATDDAAREVVGWIADAIQEPANYGNFHAEELANLRTALQANAASPVDAMRSFQAIEDEFNRKHQ